MRHAAATASAGATALPTRGTPRQQTGFFVGWESDEAVASANQEASSPPPFVRERHDTSAPPIPATGRRCDRLSSRFADREGASLSDAAGALGARLSRRPLDRHPGA